VRQAFVVTPARSGSTLLRYLLDSHPDITCPPEFNLSALLQHVIDAWRHVNAAVGESGEGEEQVASLSPDERRRARKVVDEIMIYCANTAGASLYCDKSLTTVDHLATVTQCYPDAVYIFLYRYPLDVIASGLEASKWGFNAYGFVPYVAGNPGNFVGGLANYWIDKASRMVEFERTCTVQHARIYYELLCDDPTETLGKLLEFLGVSSDEKIIERMFESEHGAGPGDYKIDFTHSVSSDSVGRGASLPRNMLGEPQIKRINEILAELDYPALETAWRGDLGSLIGLKRARPVHKGSRQIAEDLAALLAARSTTLSEMHRRALPIEVVVQTHAEDDVAVLIDEDGRGTVADADGQAGGSRPRVRSSGDVLLRVAAGEMTLAHAMHDGQVFIERGDGTNMAPNERPRRVLVALGALLRSGG
jgi:protein-tyrosine sulfotransferase